ncbi:MAG: leucine-rich repeat domain-containing protein [Muribaculaceae bacterium]|nr:leucine-rich repeat domain-containing protein [Muribaculaceae bacterium]
MNRIRLSILVSCYLGCLVCHARTSVADASYDKNMSLRDDYDPISMQIPKILLPGHEVDMAYALTTVRNMAMLATECQSLSPESGDNKVVVSVKATEFGQLEKLLEENDADTATDIIVSGPIDQSDFRALWNCAAKGNLLVLDLGDARIKDNTVPDRALFDPIEFELGKWLRIRKIILPDDVVRIGNAAFPCMGLEEINIPSSLRELGQAVFTYDYWLNCPIDLPEGVEEIKLQTFMDCKRLSYPVRMPSSMKRIGSFAFSKTPIPEIELNEGLQVIEEYAFQGCCITELRIPDSIVEIESGAFQNCWELESVALPNGMEVIPEDLFSYCYGLTKVTFPECVKVIKDAAFTSCMKLKDVVFPESLEIIGREAFEGCAIEMVALPGSVQRLGCRCFSSNNLHTVYCKSVTPPECERIDQYGPFVGAQISEAVLYVPQGSGENYRNQWEWNIFKEIVETNEFPTAVSNTFMTDKRADNVIFDLTGRKIENPLPNSIYIKNGKKRYMH